MRSCRSPFLFAGCLTDMLNIPNTITLLRIALVVVFTGVLSLQHMPCSGMPITDGTDGPTSTYCCWSIGKVIALYAFVLAAATDWLDGFLARRLNMVTTFGKLIDPLADKILVSAAFIYLTQAGYCPFWVTTLIICREFLVTGIRQIAQSHHVIMAADWSGKWKTAFQLAFCIACLVHISYGEVSSFPWDYLTSGASGAAIRHVLLWGATLLTVWSGVHYSLQSRRFLM